MYNDEAISNEEERSQRHFVPRDDRSSQSKAESLDDWQVSREPVLQMQASGSDDDTAVDQLNQFFNVAADNSAEVVIKFLGMI